MTSLVQVVCNQPSPPKAKMTQTCAAKTAALSSTLEPEANVPPGNLVKTPCIPPIEKPPPDEKNGTKHKIIHGQNIYRKICYVELTTGLGPYRKGHYIASVFSTYRLKIVSV